MKKKKQVKKAVAKKDSKKAKAPAKTTKKAVKKPSDKKQTAKKEIKIKVKSKDIEQFPTEFPFWARLKIGKNRTTLVIDDDLAWDKQKKEMVDGFVHREAIHKNKRNDYEPIYPNPDETDLDPMYLKRPAKKPKRLFKPHNKKLNMPEHLKKKYEKNNKK